MDFRIIQIYNSKRLIDYPYHITGYSSDQVTEEFIEEIISDPSVCTIGIFDLLPDKTFNLLERVYSKRPDIEFRVSGWNPNDDFIGWDLRFLTQMPSIRKLSIYGFPCFDTDLTILKNMSNLKELRIQLYEVKDYSFVKILPEGIENLYIDALQRYGRPKFDCRWLLRLKSLHTLYLGKIEQNLDCIVNLKHLKNLSLSGTWRRDLSFLKQMTVESLSISWVSENKIDWNSLRDINTLRYLKLFSIRKLSDLDFVSSMMALEKLDLVWMGSILKLPDLSKLSHLKEVNIDTANRLTDVSSLKNVKTLTNLMISNCKHLKSCYCKEGEELPDLT